MTNDYEYYVEKLQKAAGLKPRNEIPQKKGLPMLKQISPSHAPTKAEWEHLLKTGQIEERLLVEAPETEYFEKNSSLRKALKGFAGRN